MTNTVQDKNNKESRLYRIFKENDPKILMILHGITALIWVFITVMNLYSLNNYTHVNRFSPYISGGLALFYIGMTLGYAIKFKRSK